MAPPATLAELFWDSVGKHGDLVAQEWFDGTTWQARTYREFGRAVRDVAHGLMAAGIRKGDRVALWSRNCPEWGEVDFACASGGFVAVPIYDTLTGEKGAYILDDAEAKVLFVQDQAILERILPLKSKLKTVDAIVLMQGPVSAAAKKAGVQSYQEFVDAGRAWGAKNPAKLDERVAAVRPSDLASLVYTSGTTGEPKGAMLTHGNFASNTQAKGLVGVGPADVYVSFLPLSHVFERLGGHFGAYRFGCKVVFARSIDTLMEDIAHAKPTIMMAVPRLYEKIYAKVQDAVASGSGLKRKIFAWAIAVGREANAYREKDQPIPKKLQGRLKWADKLVFHKLKARVGGRLRYFVSGGAALSRDIEEFFWAADIKVLQGYGLTETSPVCNVNLPHQMRFGSVGKVIPGVTCKIDTSDWPQEKAQPEGEICYKGPNVFQGYWRNDKATKEAFDKQGWFHTGDIGYVDADGFLFITDRKKEIIVMSNGKKVPPQAVEGALKLQPHIAQACILGERRNYIAALIVPNWETLEKFALKNGIAAGDRERLVRDQRVVSLIESEVEAVNAKLSRYEQVKKFWILGDDWTVESGELTPSLKLKRRVIGDRFKGAIEKLYPGKGE